MPLDSPWDNNVIRIVWSNHTISHLEISSVLQAKDTRLAVEHILSLLNHKGHPWNIKSSKNYSPKSFIDSPETALDTLEVLFQWQEEIFNRRNVIQAKKIILWITALLSEYYENQDLYSSVIMRNPNEQWELYQAQQRLTDAFHIVVWNIIDWNFEVSSQFWDIQVEDITQNENTLSRFSWSIFTLSCTWDLSRCRGYCM